MEPEEKLKYDPPSVSVGPDTAWFSGVYCSCDGKVMVYVVGFTGKRMPMYLTYCSECTKEGSWMDTVRDNGKAKRRY